MSISWYGSGNRGPIRPENSVGIALGRFEFDKKRRLKDLGIEIGDRITSTYVYVVFPSGWKKTKKNKASTFDIYDQNGRHILHVQLREKFIGYEGYTTIMI